MLAVSKKLTPEFERPLDDGAADLFVERPLLCTHPLAVPKLIAPKQIGDTSNPVLPSFT